MWELPEVQAEFRKGKRTRDQIANIHLIIEKAREFQKNIYFCFIDYTKAFVPACVLSRFSHVRLFESLWSVAYQAPLSMGFSRQEYGSGLSSPPQGDLPNPGIKPTSLMSPALEGRFFTTHSKLEILKEVGIPDHFTCLLRSLYAGEEATVRTGHGTMDWLKIGKEIRQGCILSPCLLNFYV